MRERLRPSKDWLRQIWAATEEAGTLMCRLPWFLLLVALTPAVFMVMVLSEAIFPDME